MPAAACREPRASTRSARLLPAVLLLAASACATNPVTGAREVVFMSPEREAALGEQEAAKVAAQIGLVDDPELTAYVDEIGQRLAQHSPRQDVRYRFYVADMAEPNAFALPGGWIYVSRGLLVLTNSEDELANVIGHEIGHVAARHAAQRETRALGVGVLSALGTIAAGALGGQGMADAASQFGQLAGAGLIASYGRDQERQSDEVGQSLAAQAGYEPAAMASFLDTLRRESELRSGGPRMPSFLDSHPATAERVRDTAARAESLPPGPQARSTSRFAFLERINGIPIGADPAAGVFDGRRFLHPPLGIRIDFPPGWATQNGRSAVAAQSPGQDALFLLEMQGRSGDPQAAARDYAEARGLELQQGRALRIGGFQALRARTTARSQQGTLALDLTWISHPAGMFRLTGLAPKARFESHLASFEDAATSFASASSAELSRIRGRRLALVRARPGESLAALSRRSGNVWSLDETAVANGVSLDHRLRSGDVVKVAVEVPWSR